MLSYLVKRAFAAIVTLWLVVTLVFGIFFVIPGGGGRRARGGFSPVAVLLAGRQGTPRDIRRIERDLALDRPVHVQYLTYASKLARGDLGYSYAGGAPVKQLLSGAIPPTASIALGASVVWLVAGLVIGTLAATRGRRASRLVTMLLPLTGQSMPVFVPALLGLAVLLRLTGIYAGNRYVGVTEDPIGWLAAMWLPWISLALPLVAIYTRMVRSSLLEVEGEDFMRTAVVKGLASAHVVRHQLRAGLTPIVTMYGLDVGILLGGSVIIEQVFNIPGLGSTLLQAQVFYDFPVMAGVVIVASVAVIMMNTLTDSAYVWLDPRVRLHKVRAAPV